MEFYVTVYRGRRNVGSAFVDVIVDDLEYELLKQCYREGLGIDECGGLEGVYLEITEQAREEIERELIFREWNDDDGEPFFDIELPDEIADAVEAEDEETESAEEEQPAFDQEEDEDDDDDWIFFQWLL